LGPDLYGSSFFALDRFGGKEVWRVFTAPQSFGPLHAPAESAGIVFAGAQGGVYAAELESGRLVWKREDLVGAKDAALCGRVLLAQNQTVQVLDPRTGASLNAFLDDDPGEFPTSAYAVSGTWAFAIGNDAAYGIECEE
jgi:outer membrane protein assembly factor BamB